jgi:hypothetical protein
MKNQKKIAQKEQKKFLLKNHTSLAIKGIGKYFLFSQQRFSRNMCEKQHLWCAMEKFTSP